MNSVKKFILYLGEMLVLFVKVSISCLKFNKRKKTILKNFVTMGINTLPITVIMSFFVGFALALQSGNQLAKFNLTDLLGAIVGMALLKELGPVQAAVLIAGKVGASITAELGTMKVSDEIEALHIMGIDVTNYLLMPKFIACVISSVLLVLYTDVIGILGGAIISKAIYEISYSRFLEVMFNNLSMIDLFSNLLKAFVFGLLIAVISLYYGINTRGGAEAVGRSTTRTVVVSFISLLIANYFITKILMYF